MLLYIFILRSSDIANINIQGFCARIKELFRMSNFAKVFISYNHQNKDIANNLKDELTKENIHVVIDSGEIRVGEDITEFIEQSVRKTDITLAIVSKSSLKSAWVAMETINTLYAEKVTEKKKLFLPCLVDQSLFSRKFTDEILDYIDNELKEIEDIFTGRLKKNRGSRDLENERQRFIDLKHNLDNIVYRLRNSLCIDISGADLRVPIFQIVKRCKVFVKKDRNQSKIEENPLEERQLPLADDSQRPLEAHQNESIEYDLERALQNNIENPVKNNNKSIRKYSLSPNNRYYIFLKERDSKYYCRIQDKEKEISLPEVEVNFKKENLVTETLTLGQIVEAFQNQTSKEINELFSVSVQIQIGQFLYNHIFEYWLDRQYGQTFTTKICIFTNNEYLLKIPWFLIANNGIFMTSAGWIIFQSPILPNRIITFEKFPKTLIVFPHSKNYPKKRGENHLNELTNLLESIASDLVSKEYLLIVRNWNEFQKVESFKPQIIYYFGDCENKNDELHMDFESEVNAKADNILFTDFINQVKKYYSPQIIYINSCSDNSVRWSCIEKQLIEISPVVIISRKTICIKSSCKIAVDFFNDVLNGIEPIVAIANVEEKVTKNSFRCFKPIIYACYQSWKGIPTKNENIQIREPDWIISIDRNEQCSKIVWRIMEMIKHGKPRSLGFFWYGKLGEGVDIFHQRFRKELRNHLRDRISPLEKTVRWPEFIENISESFEEIYCHEFEVQNLDDIYIKIGRFHPYISGKKRIVFIDHKPFEIGYTKRFSSDILGEYLNWWSNRFIQCFPKDIYLILGMSFIVPSDKVDIFSEDLIEILDESESDFFVTEFLPRLKHLSFQDLREFIRTHEIPINQEKICQVIGKILHKTNGNFEKTMSLLKDIDKNWFKYLDNTTKKKRRSF